MNSLRLQFLLSLIPDKAKVIDVGTDHAYLPILLKEKGYSSVLASDINKTVLESAKKNIEKTEYDIPLVLSDGLKDINTEDYDTLVIAGMGYTTIKHILEEKEKLKSINTIILQTNNDYEKMRLFMNENNYLLDKELIFEEKNIIYHLLKYIKGKEKLTETEILFGKYNKDYKKYYQKEYDHLKHILFQVPNNLEKTKEIEHKLNLLKLYIEE